jgi:acyl dehydratase
MSTSDTRAAVRHYLDELHVGQRFVSGTHVVDAGQIVAFAAQFDPQPFHLDEKAALSTVFAGLAASGWHTAAITMRLPVEGGLPLASGFVGAGGELAWPKPTRPGDILRVDSEVIEIKPSRPRPDRGTVTVRSDTRNQRGEIVQPSRPSWSCRDVRRARRHEMRASDASLALMLAFEHVTGLAEVQI